MTRWANRCSLMSRLLRLMRIRRVLGRGPKFLSSGWTTVACKVEYRVGLIKLRKLLLDWRTVWNWIRYWVPLGSSWLKPKLATCCKFDRELTPVMNLVGRGSVLRPADRVN